MKGGRGNIVNFKLWCSSHVWHWGRAVCADGTDYHVTAEERNHTAREPESALRLDRDAKAACWVVEHAVEVGTWCVGY